MATSLKVAVIGAGLAGLTAARELQRESHNVVVFEKLHRVGGTWVYDPRVESDVLGLDPDRDIVHGSLYSSCQTTLPRELMSFTDFKFNEKVYRDPRMFPGHDEVLMFLEDFANTFELTKLIRFNTVVTRVEIIDSEITEFVVESKTDGVHSVEVFDAVVVGNGHTTEPQLPTDIPGIETWSKKQMHSHNYRVPKPFQDQIVVVIGSGRSATDISRELATVAKEVHLTSRSPILNAPKLEKLDNLWLHSKIKNICTDGIMIFEDGFSVDADIILHCTGYKYHLPFLKTNEIVSVEDKRIGPLYKHVFPPRLAPRLSFVGVPERGFTFMLEELQSRWIAHTLSGKTMLPSENEMLKDVKKYYQEMVEKGLPEHLTHNLGLKTHYLEWLFAQTGLVMEKQIKDIIEYITECYMTAGLDGYMDAFFEKYAI